jgi:group I intron endonuclease
MERIGYIYKLTAPNGKVYIGQTSSLEKRMSAYTRGNCKQQKKLYSSMKKYGWDNFQKEIITSGDFTDEGLNQLEIHYIRLFNSFRGGLNMTPGGDRPPSYKGKKQSPQTKAKISAALKGKPRSPESIAKRQATRVTNGSNAQSPEHVARRTATRIANGTYAQSPECRSKRSANMKGVGSKPVSQYTKDGVWVRHWSSIKEAGEALGVSRQAISNHLKGRLKTAGGYVWKYA